MRSSIEELIPKNKKLQTPCLFINSDYVGTLEDLEQYSLENDLKHILMNARQQDPGPLLQISRNQFDIVSFKPPRLYFPQRPTNKIVTHELKLTNLNDDNYVIYKMKTNNYKPYSVHPRQGLIPPGEYVTILVHLKESFEATPSDKFRLEGVAISYADESYIHEIDKIFEKLKDKVVKQLVPLDLNTCPENVVVEDRGNSIHIEWKSVEGQEIQPEIEISSETKKEDKKIDTPQKESTTSESINTPTSSQINNVESTLETSQEIKIEDKSETIEKDQLETSPDVQDQSKIEDDVEIKIEEQVSQIIETPEENDLIDISQQETDERDLSNLSLLTKKELEQREIEPVKNEEIQHYIHSLESLKIDYNKSIEEISKLMESIQTLENENKTINTELSLSRTEIHKLKEKLQDLDGLKYRKQLSNLEEEPKTTPELVEKQLNTSTNTHPQGFNLFIVCLVAIICFILGNILS